MGGCGSGRRGRKHKTSRYPQIDVRQWLQAGYFALDRPFGPIWSGRVGEVTARFWVHIEHRDWFTLLSRYNYDDGREWAGTDVSLYFERTPCHYGHSRIWFVCPGCRNRAAILYCENGKRWICRKCLNLTYASQCEDVSGRAHRRIAKIERKLSRGKDGSKPEGMHYRTYEGLMAEKARAEAVITQETAKRLGGLMQCVGRWAANKKP